MIKLEGVVTTADQKSFDWISCVFWWRQGTDWTCLAHPTAEETSVTRAVESDRQEEMRFRKIAGETAILKLNWLGEGFPLKTKMGFTWFIGGKELVLDLCKGQQFSSSGSCSPSHPELRESSVNGPCVSWWGTVIKLLALTSELWKTGKRGLLLFLESEICSPNQDWFITKLVLEALNWELMIP